MNTSEYSEIADFAKTYSEHVENADAALVFLPSTCHSVACLHLVMRDGTEEVTCCEPERDEMLEMMAIMIEDNMPESDAPDDPPDYLPF